MTGNPRQAPRHQPRYPSVKPSQVKLKLNIKYKNPRKLSSVASFRKLSGHTNQNAAPQMGSEKRKLDRDPLGTAEARGPTAYRKLRNVADGAP